MNKELLWYWNIKLFIFNDLDLNQYENVFNTFNSYYAKKSNKIWCNATYINHVLSYYFVEYKRLDDPLSVFYALMFYNSSVEFSNYNYENYNTFIHFLKMDRSFDIFTNLHQDRIKFLMLETEWLNNDIGVTENDFNIFSSILKITSPILIDDTIYSGMFISNTPSLAFSSKGKIETNTIFELIPLVLDELIQTLDEISDRLIFNLFKTNIEYLIDQQKHLKPDTH